MDQTQKPPFRPTARIGKGGIVEALTGQANDYWIAQQAAAGITVVAYGPDNPAHVGLPYDAKTGLFAQPAPEPAPVDPIAAAYERGKADGAAEALGIAVDVPVDQLTAVK